MKCQQAGRRARQGQYSLTSTGRNCGGNRGKTLPQEQIEKIRAGQLAYRARVRAIIKAAEEAGITPEDN